MTWIFFSDWHLVIYKLPLKRRESYPEYRSVQISPKRTKIVSARFTLQTEAMFEGNAIPKECTSTKQKT
jgi:hypothetical protein